jgi:hypothetical protein
MKDPVILASDSSDVVLSDLQESLLEDWLFHAKKNGYTDIITIKENSGCGVFLKGGGNDDIRCMAVSMDDLGHWWVLRLDGTAVQYLYSEVL